jgi:uncharacterized protein with PhoU and TrkA domain
VKDALKRMRDISTVMVDLGYYSALYGDPALADEILRLGGEVKRLEFNLMMQAGLATRSPDEAESMVSVYQLAVSMGRVCDEAMEIARISKAAFSLSFPMGFASVDNVVCRSQVSAGSWADGKSLSEVFKKLRTVVNVLLLRRGEKWAIEPDPNFVLAAGDTLFTIGSLGRLKLFRGIVGCAEPAPPQREVSPVHKKVVEWLAQLLSLTDLVVDLAYAALLASSEDIARSVVEIEELVDQTLVKFESDVVSSDGLSPGEKIALLEIAVASERISDAAAGMVEILLHGLESHPIIADVLQESEERITVTEAGPEDSGKKIKELAYGSYGAAVLAVKRGGDWHVRPNHGTFGIKKGDLLIVKYYAESTQMEEFAEDLKTKEERSRIIEELREDEMEEP